MKKQTSLLLFSVSVLSCQGQQSFPEWLDQSLRYQTPGGLFSTELNGLADFEAYTIDENPPGLVFGTGDYFISPRLSLFLDSRLGEQFYSLVQVRVDRGFDPGSAPGAEARLDEYFLRYTPWKDGRLNLQVGKFATVFGNWVARHDSWNNPFVNAPLPYENVLIVTDHTGAPDAKGFLARKSKPDQKATWLPVLWGPSYASGASVFGAYQQWDYAFELKNASLSSRPSVWDATSRGFENPTWTGRLGWRPDAEWTMGISGSHGGYLLEPAAASLPAGTGLDDYAQTTAGFDLGFARKKLQIWSEVVASRFEIPNVGAADSIGYYLEAKYRFDARWFGALRWNQQFFGDVKSQFGALERWEHDIWRGEIGLGCRLTRHWQIKSQYSYSRQEGPLQQGEQMFAGQVTFKF